MTLALSITRKTNRVLPQLVGPATRAVHGCAKGNIMTSHYRSLSRIDAYLYVFYFPSLLPSLPPSKPPKRAGRRRGGEGRGSARRFAVRFRSSARLRARSTESTHYAGAAATECQHHADDCRHQHPDGLCHHCLGTVVIAYWRVVSCIVSSIGS